MSKVILNDTTLTAIAEAIRTKGGSQEQFLPSEMPAAIANLPSGGGGGASWPDTVQKDIVSSSSNRTEMDVVMAPTDPHQWVGIHVAGNPIYGSTDYIMDIAAFPQQATIYQAEDGAYIVPAFAGGSVGKYNYAGVSMYGYGKFTYLYSESEDYPMYYWAFYVTATGTVSLRYSESPITDSNPGETGAYILGRNFQMTVLY